jgi:hypothetical protein
MMFVNPPGMENFRALRVESGDQHLYWQPTYQHLLRVEGAFGEFFPQADFSEGGNQVIFTKYIDKVEVLSRTRALRSGERIPRGEWQRFMETWANFKRLADRTDIPEDVRTFIHKFGPPSVERYPAAYRIYRPHWYSRSRLFILWGLEPVGGAEFVSLTPEEAISEASARAETDGEETSGNFLRWLKIFFFVLLALGLLLFILWLCLPRPQPDFAVLAEVDKPAKVENLTKLDRDLEWGVTEYRWTFEGAAPAVSAEKNPSPTWKSSGQHGVTLEATQSTLWGLLYKSETLGKPITVTQPESSKSEAQDKQHVGKGSSNSSVGNANKGAQKRSHSKPDTHPEVGAGGPHAGKGDANADGSKGKMNPSDQNKGSMPPDDGLVSHDDKKKSSDAASKGAGVSAGMNSEPNGGAAAPGAAKADKAEGKPAPDKPDAPKGMNPGNNAPSPGDVSGGSSGPNASGQKGPASKNEKPNDKGAAKNDPGMAPGGKSSPAGKDAPSSPLDGASKPEGGANKSKPASAAEGANPSGSTKSPAKPGQGEPKTPPAGNPGVENGTKPNGSAKIPKGSGGDESDGAQGSSRTLPVPSVQILSGKLVGQGASQIVDFRLNVPSGVKVERLIVSGVPVNVPSQNTFRIQLDVGLHSVQIEYSSPTSGLRGKVIQDVMVDRDPSGYNKPGQSSPMKGSGSGRSEPPAPAPGNRPRKQSPSRDEAADQIDKKIA